VSPKYGPLKVFRQMDFVLNHRQGDVWEAVGHGDPNCKTSNNFQHGWTDAGVLVFSDSQGRTLAIKKRFIEGHYTLISSYGGHGIDTVPGKKTTILNEATTFFAKYGLKRQIIVIMGGTNDIDMLARNWRPNDPRLHERIKSDTAKLVQKIQDWINDHRSISKRFMIVGVMRRFDEVMQKPDLPDPLKYMSLSQFCHIRDLGIRSFNDQLSNWLAGPSPVPLLYYCNVEDLFSRADFTDDGVHPDWEATTCRILENSQPDSTLDEYSPRWKLANHIFKSIGRRIKK
jgi:hypothetical protein